MVRSPPKAPFISSGPSRPPGSKYSSRSYMPGRDERDFYAREDEYGNQYPPYTGPLGTYNPGYIFDPRSRAPTTQNASFSTGFASGLSAYQNYVAKYYGPGVTSHNSPLALARAATGAVEKGLKTGAGWLGHAAAGLLGAPLGPSGGRAAAGATNTGGGIGSDVGAVSGVTPTNRLYGGNPGTGAGISAYVPGTSRQGMDGVLDAISQAEGTVKNGYNEILGSGAYGRPSKPITDMTLQEVHDFGRNTLFAGQRAQGKKEKELSSATGRYQITGDNIKTYATKWGLDMKTTKWTPQLQDRIAIDLATNTPKKLTNWEGLNLNSKLMQRATAALHGKPVSALAYSTTDSNLTPAQRAAAAEAAGTSGSTSNVTDRGDHIAAMQRDLNSRGAKLTVDGLEGPLTRQAEQQFYGSPTSVRTPNITNRPTYTSGQQDQGSVPRVGVQSTPSINQPYTPAAATPRTPYYNNPYTNSTGGASYTSGRGDEGRGVPAQPSMGIPRQVQAVDISGSSMPPRPFQPTETARLPRARPDIPGQSSYTSGRGDEGVVPRPGVYTSHANIVIPYSGRQDAGVIPHPGISGADVAPQRTPYLNQPYTMSTGGANAITARVPQARPPQPGDTPTPYLNQPYTMPAWGVQAPTARIPQARPNYQPPQQAVPTLLDRLGNLVERAERALSGGNRGSDSSRDGGGSRSSQGNYSGGSYGGQGGSRISEGVGGAFRNR